MLNFIHIFSLLIYCIYVYLWMCEYLCLCVCVCASVCRLEDDQHSTVYMIKSEDDVWKSYRPFPFMGQVTKLKLWGCCQVVLIAELSRWSLNHFLNTSLIYLFPLKRDYTEFFLKKKIDLFLFYMEKMFLSESMYVHQVQVHCPLSPQNNIEFVLNGVNTQLWADIWVMGKEPRSSVKAVGVVNSWAFSLALYIDCFLCY